MEIRERAVGAVAVLDAVGRMVLTETEDDRALREKVIQLVSAGHRQLVVNLGAVTQVDTAGLTSLVSAHVAAVRRGAHLSLANPTPRIRELLRVTRLNFLLETYDTEEDAIASVTRPSGSGL